MGLSFYDWNNTSIGNSDKFTAFLPWAIDTHCHLDHSDFDADLTVVWEQSGRQRVPYAIIPATDYASFQKARAITRQFTGLWCAAGLHPHEASRYQDLAGIQKALELGDIVAVGETGLDYHYKYSSPEDQASAFQYQIELAQNFNLPLIIHIREAWDEARILLGQYNLSNLKLVFHAFSGDEDDADWVKQHGGFLGIGGVVTFGNAERLRRIVRCFPRERMMLETDAPYLTPEPFRGRRNLPFLVGLVAERLAQLWGVPTSEVRALTSLTARRVFKLPRRGKGAVIYKLHNNIYVNITNRCSNECAFCLRYGLKGIGEADLWLDLEPTAAEVLVELEQELEYTKPAEVVFCGFGEPTMRWDDVLLIGRKLKKQGMRLRLDTNGLGSISSGRDICGEVADVMDAVSVSMNVPDAASYQQVCQPRYPNSFQSVLDFIKGCVQRGVKTTVSAVGGAVSAEATSATEKLAIGLGAHFRLRARV